MERQIHLYFEQLRQEIRELGFAWKMFLMEQAAKVRVNFLSLGFFLIFLGWLGFKMKNLGYAQVGTQTYNSFLWLERFISWMIGGGLASVFVGIARRQYLFFKRLADIVLSFAGLVVLSPLFLIIGILIKTDSAGPVFYRQKRQGKDGRLFDIWKFRTMRRNAELETGPVWASKDDPRITRIGRFLRDSHLDELPQLANVLRGEMSLVGPCAERPELVEEIKSHIPGFDKRLKVKPGITGLAQVKFRYAANVTEVIRKLRYDLLYVEKMCWFLDFKILLWTAGKVLAPE